MLHKVFAAYRTADQKCSMQGKGFILQCKFMWEKSLEKKNNTTEPVHRSEEAGNVVETGWSSWP